MVRQLGNKTTLKQNQLASRRKALCNRIKKASKDAVTIKKDLQRDCIPYWKLDTLREDLDAIVEDLKNVV